MTVYLLTEAVQAAEAAYEALIEAGVATEGEMALVTYISGYSLETLEAVLYARTGYRDLVDYLNA